MFFTLDSARPTGGMATFDRATMDSTGAFFVNELERLDQKLHDPLVQITWPRDIDLREDVTLGDDSSSFTNSTYASPGGVVSNGISWMGRETNAVTSISVDIGKTVNPLTPWAEEVKYTVLEVEKAARLGRPIDQQKYNGMKLKHQMDIDQMVYAGDLGYAGLFNSSAVAASSVVPGNTGSLLWVNKTPDEIVDDVNNLCVAAWKASGYARFPDRLLLPQGALSLISMRKVSQAGNISILEYIMANSLSNRNNGHPLDIQGVKWADGMGVGGTPQVGNAGFDRMLAYTKDMDLVRYPMTTLARTPVTYQGAWITTTYLCQLGVIEYVYPETLSYADGLS